MLSVSLLPVWAWIVVGVVACAALIGILYGVGVIGDSSSVATASPTPISLDGDDDSAPAETAVVRFDCSAGLDLTSLRDVESYPVPEYSSTLHGFFSVDYEGNRLLMSGSFPDIGHFVKREPGGTWDYQRSYPKNAFADPVPLGISFDGTYAYYDGNIVWLPTNDAQSLTSVFDYGDITGIPSEVHWVDPDNNDFVTGMYYFRQTGANTWVHHSNISEHGHPPKSSGKGTLVNSLGNIVAQNPDTLVFDIVTPYPYTLPPDRGVASVVSTSGEIVVMVPSTGEDNQIRPQAVFRKGSDGQFTAGPNIYDENILPHDYLTALDFYKESHVVFHDNFFADNPNNVSNVYILAVTPDDSLTLQETTTFTGRNSAKGMAKKERNDESVHIFAADGGILYEKIIECVREV